jgi:hypothetical protein
VDLASELAQERSPVVGEARSQPRSGIEGLGDLEEVRRIEPAAACRTLDPRADVARRPDPDPRSLLEHPARLVRLVERPRHDDRIRGRLECLRQPPGRPEVGQAREPLADRRVFEEDLRARIHRARQRRRAGPESAGLPATVNRHGSSVHGAAA